MRDGLGYVNSASAYVGTIAMGCCEVNRKKRIVRPSCSADFAVVNAPKLGILGS